MAYTKKTVKTEAAKVEIPVAPVVEKPKTEAKHDSNDKIKCRSITTGEMIMIGQRTGDMYDFIDYDDTIDVSYEDLVAAIRAKSCYIFDPLFIIEDELFLKEYPKIQELYDSLYGNGDFEKILELPLAQMKDAVKNLPSGVLPSFKSYVSTAINDGILDSLKKIKALDDLLGTKMTFYLNDEE